MGRAPIDLDAARGEITDEPIPVIFKQREWLLPSELPASVLDPLFAGELDDLIGLLVELIGEDADTSKSDDVDWKAVVARLRTNPRLVSGTALALRSAFEQLLGPEQWEDWLALRPSIGDYLRFGRGVWAEYGVSLGEALGLSSTSAAGGETSKPTSQRGKSTRGGSGSRRATRN